MKEEKQKLLFCSYFRHISLWFYSNFDRESSLDAEFDSTSNEYPHCILLMDPTTTKTRNTWKNMMMSTHTAYFWRTPLPQKQEIPEKMWWWHHHYIFSRISCFLGSGVHKKYAVWVIVGCRIKFRIQQALLLRIWVNTQGDMSKIWTKI